MDYLVKDLSSMTGISSAAIRKWQERFGILKPIRSPNGYWHYSTEDYFVLKSIQQRLSDRQAIGEIMRMGRRALLEDSLTVLSEPHQHFVKLLQSHSYDQIQRIFEKGKRGTFSSWINRTIRPHVVLVGKAWEAGLISVAEEHGFTEWLRAYLFGKIKATSEGQKRGWLCVTFPEDPHELSSLMHYCVLRSRGVPAWFCGNLPWNLLMREVQSGKYKGVAISVVLHQSEARRKQLSQSLSRSCPEIRIAFGGFALKN